MSTKTKGSKKTAAENKLTGKAGFCCYIGPTIVGVIQNGTILPGTKQEAAASLSGAVEKYPLIASLIVSGDTLAEDRIKVKTPGNLLYVNYRKLAGK